MLRTPGRFQRPKGGSAGAEDQLGFAYRHDVIVAPILKTFHPPDQPGLTIGLTAAWYLPGFVVLNLTEQRPGQPQNKRELFFLADLESGQALPPAGGGGGGGTFGSPPISHLRSLRFFHCDQMPQAIRIQSTTSLIDESVQLTPATSHVLLDLTTCAPGRPTKDEAHRLLNMQAVVGMLPVSVDSVEPASFELLGVGVSPFAVERWPDSQRVWLQVEPDQSADVDRLFEPALSDLGLRLQGSQGISTTGHQGAAGTLFSVVFPSAQR